MLKVLGMERGACPLLKVLGMERGGRGSWETATLGRCRREREQDDRGSGGMDRQCLAEGRTSMAMG